MAKASMEGGGRWLNAALVLGGLALLLLLYALAARFLFPRTDPLRETNPAGLVGEIIQVEVRNGCGVSGLAARATRYLRDHGFDVVEVGDHDRFDEPYSYVVDRVGDLEAARKVAHVMGIPETRVRQEIRPEVYLDASIVIGQDYATLSPFREE